MKQTVAEKILSKHCGHEVSAGESAIFNIDFLMASDTTASLAIKAFEEMGGKTVKHADRIAIFLDHAAPPPTQTIANVHSFIRKFAYKQNIALYEIGRGICHQLVIEDNLVKAGEVAIGADSHACTYGAIGAFSVGIGSTDLALSMMTGKNWLKVPRSIYVRLSGKFKKAVYAKDLMLHFIGKIGSNGANYQSIEFDTENELPLSDRLTICNMVSETGAKNGLFYDKNFDVFPDNEASYSSRYMFDLSTISPQIACPQSVDNVLPVDEIGNVAIQQGFLGSCTNGRIEDLREAAMILHGRKIKKGCRLIVTPASVAILKQSFSEGVMQSLLDAGATLVTPGCGACVGTHNGVPGNGENVISTTNRNFKGRMGNDMAKIYLASPATVAASLITGRITDPREAL